MLYEWSFKFAFANSNIITSGVNCFRNGKRIYCNAISICNYHRNGKHHPPLERSLKSWTQIRAIWNWRENSSVKQCDFVGRGQLLSWKYCCSVKQQSPLISGFVVWLKFWNQPIIWIYIVVIFSLSFCSFNINKP